MKWGCCLSLIACSAILSEAQGTADGCITCAVGDFFKTGVEDWILPAAGTLQFLVPNPVPVPDTNIPKTDPGKQRTNDLPGSVDQPDIELENIASPIENCDPNGAGSTSCAVATAQIIWPVPATCGDETQASRILDEINRLAPTGRVRPFHNKCGTWFFTASLTPSQAQQLMGENIGIKFIEPDAEMEDDMEISSGVQKRRLDKLHVHRQPRVQKRVEPDFIHVVRYAPLHLSYLSTAPNRHNQYAKYAYFDSAGVGTTVYWIDSQFYMPNPDLTDYEMAANRLMAEGISPSSEEWTGTRDHGGCMLSIIGGTAHGVIPSNPTREDRPRLKIVRVDLVISSFFSGIEAIITQLELRTEGNERVSTYTVIGTALAVPQSRLGRMLQLEAAVLFKLLTTQYQAIVVVSSGTRNHVPAPENFWPATIAGYPDIPIIVVSGAHYYFSSPVPSAGPYITLNAPSFAVCKHINNDARVDGASPAVAILTALAADMLTRPKVRAKLFIDDPALAPDEQKLMALQPVSAKIRDYLDSLAFDHWNLGLRGVWNGLDPDNEDINQYSA